MCSTRSVAVTPSRKLPGQVHADDFRREKINRLPEHARFRFDSADAPADDAEAVDHRRVRIGADERVGIENCRLPFRAEHALGEIFEVHLVHDADARRNELESLERLLPPFQKLVALAVALEFHVHVQLQGLGRAGEIDLHRVIDHEIDRHERLDDLRIAAESLHRAAHRRQIDHQRHAGEILQNNARDDERNLFVRRRLRVPVRQRLDIFAPNFLAVAISQHRFEHDANADRQPRNLADALFFQRGQRMQEILRGRCRRRISVSVLNSSFTFSSASFALILSKFGSARASSLHSAY